MKILNLKFKAHRLINYIFYLIVFILGFLLGGGNISNLGNISDILLIDNVKALEEEFTYTDTDGSYYKDIKSDLSLKDMTKEEYIMNLFKKVNEDYSLELNFYDYENVIVKYYNKNYLDVGYYYSTSSWNGEVNHPSLSENSSYLYISISGLTNTADIYYIQESAGYSPYNDRRSNTTFYSSNTSLTGTYEKLSFRELNKIKDYGDNEYGINAGQITISTNNFSGKQIKCPNNREFKNEYCYYKKEDFNTGLNLKETSLTAQYRITDDDVNIPYRANKTYLFTYRTTDKYTLIPVAISYNSQLLSGTAKLIKYYIRQGYGYTDYQILFTMNDSDKEAEYSFYITNLSIMFDRLYRSFNTIPDDFNTGFYKVYKYKEFNYIPTDKEIKEEYEKNTLDEIKQTTMYDTSDSYLNGFINETYGIESIIRAPLVAINNISTGTCTPFNITLKNTTITLPCGNYFWSRSDVSDFKTFWTFFTTGIISYGVGLGLVRLVSNAKNPSSDKLEVLKL